MKCSTEHGICLTFQFMKIVDSLRRLCVAHPTPPPFKVLIVNDNTVFLDICIYITYVLKFFKFVEKVF